LKNLFRKENVPGPQVCGKISVDFPTIGAYNDTIESDRTPRTNGNEPNDSAQRKRTTHLDNGIPRAVRRTKAKAQRRARTKNQFLEEKNYDY